MEKYNNMRAILIFLAILPFSIVAQIHDTFEDGNFSQSPAWTGTVDKFIIDAGYRLQLNAPAEASSAWLFTQNTAIEEAAWNFDLILEFNPSSSNYAKIWIAADNADPLQIKNGIALSVGAADDAFVLQQTTDGKTATMIKGMQGRLNYEKIVASVKITRTGNSWQLDINMGDGWVSEGVAEFNPRFGSTWFGLVCNYTQTRSNKFWFDNILVQGNPRQDKEKPYVTSHRMTNPDKIEVEFNEPVLTQASKASFSAIPNTTSITITQPQQNLVQLFFHPIKSDLINETLRIENIHDEHHNTLADTSLSINYTIFGITDVKVIPPDAVIITFNHPLALMQDQAAFVLNNETITPTSMTIKESALTAIFPFQFEKNVANILRITGVQDIDGNTILPVEKNIGYQEPSRNSIIITEFMPDPEPSMGLPASEYIELYNTTPFDIDLKDWKISVNQTTATLNNYTLPSLDYVILCSSTEINQFNSKKKTAPSRWPVITNSGASMVLTSPQGVVSDALQFDLTKWGDQSFKEDGGWSFEIIDQSNRSGSAENWSFTGNLHGGTPAEINSNSASNPDKKEPSIHYIKPIGGNSFKISFTEPVNIELLRTQGQMTVNGYPEKISVVHFDEVFLKSMVLTIIEQPVPGKIYQIDNMPIVDLAGNAMTYGVMARYGIPEPIEPKDAIINEILFNTAGDAPDFLEIMNNSSKIIEFKQLSIGKMIDGKITTLAQLTNNDRLFFPGDYFVAAPDSLKTVANYNCTTPQWVVKTSNFPSLSDDGECLVLTKSNGEMLENFCYDKKMHHPLLIAHDGVSLERIDPSQPANNRDNWHSASTSSGSSTPTSINSQYKPIDLMQDNSISLLPSYFTPDGDGTDDYMMIQYKADQPGWHATVTIYDSRGRPIKYLVNNGMMGMEGFWIWNGLDDNNLQVSKGNYIVLIKMFNDTGSLKEFKKSCTIGVPHKE